MPNVNIELLMVGSKHKIEKITIFIVTSIFEVWFCLKAFFISMSFLHKLTQNPGIGLKW